MGKFGRDALEVWRSLPLLFWILLAAGNLVLNVHNDWRSYHHLPSLLELGWHGLRTIGTLGVAIVGGVIGLRVRRRKEHSSR
jgi:hypothetical protein